jgi:transposase
VHEVTDEPLYLAWVCGIDIGKAGLEACIRVPSEASPKRRAQEIRSFGTTRKEVLALADWLRCWGVTGVVMESTDYWKGPFYRLEAEGFGCVLADAKQVRHLPGRPRTTGRMPGGWRSASSAARSRRVSWPPRSSG